MSLSNCSTVASSCRSSPAALDTASALEGADATTTLTPPTCAGAQRASTATSGASGASLALASAICAALIPGAGGPNATATGAEADSAPCRATLATAPDDDDDVAADSPP
jgi:hypothetical protein